MNPHIWTGLFKLGAGVYRWRDVALGFGSKPWLRKYLAQVTLYSLLKGSEKSLLLCLNKSTGELAQVDVPLDYDYAEEILRRAERVNAHVDAGTLPERIPFDDSVCPRCPFYALCLPSHIGRAPIAFLEDDEVEWLLEERAHHAEDALAYRKLDERVKAWAKARDEERMTVGRWLIVKRPFARGVRVDVSAIGAESPETSG